jgi:opacity protein-like surface antigen
MEGISAWADYGFSRSRWSIMHNFGVEVVGHDIRFNVPEDFSQMHEGTMREDTLLGGVTYTWRKPRSIHPYVKGLMGVGSIDFPHPSDSGYGHDTRTVSAMGGGVDVHAYRNLWVRADYEYQVWPKMFGPDSLTPNGLTLGVSYDFRHRNGR